jgi:hypothetical protein
MPLMPRISALYGRYTLPRLYLRTRCAWLWLDVPPQRTRRHGYPALLPHSARGHLPHLRFPHSGAKGGERAPMCQAGRCGGHARRNAARKARSWIQTPTPTRPLRHPIALSPRLRAATTTTAHLQLSPHTSATGPLYPWHKCHNHNVLADVRCKLHH